MGGDETKNPLHPNMSLGDRLLEGVRNLWGETKRIDKVQTSQGQEIENLKRRLNALESEVHGLKISRGRTKAKNARLEQQIGEAESKLAEVKRMLQ